MAAGTQAKETRGEGPQSPFVLTQFVDRACPAPRSPPFTAPPALSLPNPTSQPLGPSPTWLSPSLGALGAPNTSTDVGACSAAPPPARQHYQHPAGSLRSEGHRSRAPGSQQPRREAPAEGRAPAVLGFSSCRGRRDCSVSVGDRARRALRPPQLPSSACSPYQSDGLQRKDRRHSARPFEPDGGGNRRDSRRSTEGQLAAGSRGETRRVAAGAGRE